jgi:hypothetical protein
VPVITATIRRADAGGEHTVASVTDDVLDEHARLPLPDAGGGP